MKEAKIKTKGNETGEKASLAGNTKKTRFEKAKKQRVNRKKKKK
jgi:hypothetical protein